MLYVFKYVVQVKAPMDNENLYKECVNGGGGLSQYISCLCGDKVRDIIVYANMLCVVFDVLFSSETTS